MHAAVIVVHGLHLIIFDRNVNITESQSNEVGTE